MKDHLQVLRTLDKADRMEAPDVFDLLTKGRLDKSGDFTKGCGLTNSQAAVLTWFVFFQKNSLIRNRFELITLLEDKVIDEKTGKTAWDQLLDWYQELPEPRNIAWILDDLCEEIIRKGKQMNEQVIELADVLEERKLPESKPEVVQTPQDRGEGDKEVKV